MKEFESVVRDLPGVSIQAFRLIDSKYVPYQTSRAPLAVSSVHCPHCSSNYLNSSTSRQHSNSSVNSSHYATAANTAAVNPSSPHSATSFIPSSMLNTLLPPYSFTNGSTAAHHTSDHHQSNGESIATTTSPATTPATAIAHGEVNVCLCHVGLVHRFMFDMSLIHITPCDVQCHW